MRVWLPLHRDICALIHFQSSSHRGLDVSEDWLLHHQDLQYLIYYLMRSVVGTFSNLKVKYIKYGFEMKAS